MGTVFETASVWLFTEHVVYDPVQELAFWWSILQK